MRALRWTLWLVLALALSWVLLALSGWLPRLSQQQKDDLALLRHEDAAPAGTNAYAGLLLQGYVVPVEQQDALLAEVVAARRAQPRWSQDQLRTLVSARHATLPELTVDLPCGLEQVDCLLEVRGRHDEVAALVSAHAQRLANWRTLEARADHLWDPVPETLDAPSLIEWRHARLPRIAAALAWAEQPGAAALGELCHHAAFWRKARTGTNLLLADMLAINELGLSARLLAGMLSEWPEDQAVPDSCGAWLGMLADAELQHCAIARREFATMDHALSNLSNAGATIDGDDSASGWLGRITGSLMYQPQPTLGLLAGGYAAACRDPLAPRAPDQLAAPPGAECGWLGQLFNPVGCVIAGVAGPDQRGYHLRRLDLDAQLRALELALRWRTHPEQRPTAPGPVDGWAQQWHPLQVDVDARQLVLGLKVPRTEPRWALPWPWPAAGAAAAPTTSGTAMAVPPEA